MKCPPNKRSKHYRKLASLLAGINAPSQGPGWSSPPPPAVTHTHPDTPYRWYLLQLFELLISGCNIHTPMLQVVQTPNFVALSRSVQLPDGAKRSLHPSGQRGQKIVKGCHLPRIHNHLPSGKERVSVPVDDYSFCRRRITSPCCARHT